MLSKKRFTFHTPYVMILLAIVIISATSTVLEQHAGGEVSANGARDKFEGDFYDKIQVLIHETARADIQIQRDVQGKNHEYPVARDPARYYHIIIQIDGDGEEEVRLNKRSVVDMLEAAGARDIVPADVLSFVTASVPVTEIPRLSLLGEVHMLGDGEIPTISQTDTARQTIRAATADLAEFSEDIINGSGVTVAIIDHGIYHVDLNSKIDARIYCPTGSCTIDGGSNPTTLSDEELDNLISNDTTHGTKVAQVVAASGLPAYNGIAPGVRLLDGYSPTRSAVIRALDWALTEGADIAQLSISVASNTCVSTYLLNEAINQAVSNGMVVVSAAGNDGNVGSALAYHTVVEPSCAQNVITVGGVNDRPTHPLLYLGSSLGPVTSTTPRLVPHLVAPAYGINVLAYSSSSNHFRTVSGTSYAAPMVSAAAAMMLQLNPDLAPAETKSLLLLGSDWTGPVPCTSTQYETSNSSDNCSHTARRDYNATSTLETLNHVGFGMLDVAKSLEYAVNSSSHVVSDNFDSSTRSVLYGLNVTEPLAKTKVLLTWLVPFNFNHNDANFDFTITCPGLDKIIRAESNHQTVEFAVFEPAEAGVCAVLATAKTGEQDFTLTSTHPLGPPPSEFAESNIAVSSDDGTYTLDEKINITVEFSRAVQVNGTSQPYLELDMAPTTRHATYEGISADGKILYFVYVVQEGDAATDLSYTGTDALVVPSGGNLTDAHTGIPVRPVLPSPGEEGSLSATRDIVINTNATAPSITAITRHDPISQTTLVFEVMFSEDVTGVDVADFVISSGSTGEGSIADLTGSGSKYLVSVSATQDGTYNLDLVSSGHGITDTANNPLTDTDPIGDDHTYTVDTIAPTVTSIERNYPADQITNSQTLVFEIAFNENVAGVDAADFVLSPGSTEAGSIASLTGSGNKYLVSVSATQDGTYNLDLVSSGHGITDTANNPLTDTDPIGDDHTYTVDTIAPTVTSIERNYPADQITNSQTLVFEIAFNENVAGVDAADFVLSPGSTEAGSIASLTGSGNKYLVSVSATQDGTYNLDLVSSGHGITDTANNPLTDTDPIGDDHTYTVDTIAPTVTSIERNYPADQITNSQTLVFEIAFNENVAGVDAADFVLSPGSTEAGSIASLTGFGNKYLVSVSATQDGTYNLDLVFSDHDIADVASNPLTNTVPAGADETYTVSTAVIDDTAPTLASIQRYTPATENTDSQTLVYKATFSEDVTGVTASDFTLSPGSAEGESATSTSTGQFTQTRSPHLTIPDLTTVSDAITVSDSETATSVSVEVDITHAYIGDLKIDIIAPDGTSRTLHNHSGGSTNDIDQTYAPLFGSIPISGVWTLQIYDDYNADPGVLNSWTLTINYGDTATTVSPVTGISGSGDVYYVTVSATQDGTYNLDLVSSNHDIADAASNPLTNTTPTGADETYTVSTVVTDSTAPTVSSIERYSPSGATTDSQTLVYKATFSEDVTGVTASDFTLSPGSAEGESATSTSTGQFTQTRSPHLTIPDLTTVSDAITVSDSETATSVSVEVDITHAYIGDLKIDLIAPDGTSRTLHNRSGGSTNDIDKTYAPLFGSIPISGVWTLQIYDGYNADPGVLNSWTLTINYGDTATTVSPVTGISGSGDVYYVTVSATQDGTYNLDLVSSNHDIADAASNPLTNTTPTGADETYTVSTVVTDSTAPTVSSIERYSPSGATTDSQTLVYRITFSEDVTGVDKADFALSPGNTGGTSTSSGQFTQTRSPSLAIPDNTTVSDAITVAGSGTATSVTVAVDITHTYIGDLKIDLVAPDGTTKTLHNRSGGSIDDINQEYTPDFDGVPIAGTWSLRIHDNYDADSGTLNDWTLTINHGSTTTASPVTSVSGSDDTYYATVSSTQAGTYNLDLVSSGHGIADTASNPLANTTPTGADETYTFSTTVTDSTAPTVSSIERYSPSGATTDSQTLVYRITFSEDVTGVGTADFALSSDSTGETNGNNPVTSISGSGSVYYAEVSASTDGTYNLDLVSSGHGITDTASNPLANTTPTGADETYTVSTVVTDSTAPTVSSIERYSPSGATTDSQTLVYRITFSEDVTGVDKADFALSPGNTGGTSTSSGQFTQTRSPSLAIPDNTTVSDAITVAGSGTATSVTVAVDITHTYIGDLKIDLVAPDGTTKTLHNRSGGSIDDINQEYTPDFDGVPIAGTWSLRIHDNYDADSGTLNDWTLTINHGSTTTASPVTSVSGSDDTYYATVSSTQAGTYNLDLVSSGHGIADTASNPLANTTPTGADETYTFSTTVTDSTAPTVSSIERYSPSGATTDSQTLVYRITFSEDVTGVGTADFALSSDSTGETNGNNPVTSISGSGSVYYAEVSASTDGTYNLDLVSSGHGITDTASNPLANTTPTGADETYTVSTVVTDSTAPTVSSIERYSPSGATTDSQTLVYRITFSEDVTGVDKADFALSPGNTGGTSTSSGQFTQTRSPSLAIPDNTTVSDAITVAGSGTATSVTVAVDITHTYIGDLKIDLVAPDGTTKTLHNRSGGSIDDINQEYTPDFDGVPIAGTWSLRIHDNYDADSGTLNDWTLTINHGSTTTASPVTSVSGSDDTYYATVSSTQAGTYNLDLVSSGHGIADTASNPLANTTPTGADETYTFSTTVTDSTAPTVSSIERYSPSGATTDSQTLVYRITFSEDVTGVGTADFALSSDSTGETNGNNPVTSISGSGSVYYAEVSASTDGTYNLDLVSSGHGIADTASNPLTNTATTGADQTYTVSTTVVNTTNPRLESIERYSPASQNTNSQYLIYKATFSKSVTGVGASDFVLSPGSTGGGNNGTSPVAGITGSGDTYYVIVSSAVDGTYNLDLVSSGHNIADAASNPLTNTATTGADQTYTVS